MPPILLTFLLFSNVYANFMNMLMGSSSAPLQQYRAYAGCSSSGCVPATIVPKSSGFWPNADMIAGLQTEQRSQNQNQNSNNPQQDDPRTSQSTGQINGNVPGSSSSNQQPVIYIARAGSDKYKNSEVTTSTPTPNGFNFGNGFQGGQNQNTGFSSGFFNNQNQNSNQNLNQNNFQQNQNLGASSGFFNNQNQQNSQQNQVNGPTSGFSNQQTSNQNSGFFNNQNQQNGQNFGNSGNQNGVNPYSGAFSNGQNQNQQGFFGNNQNNQQNSNGQVQGSQNNQIWNQNQNPNILPFGPNLVNSNTQFGPQPFQPIQPGGQAVQFVGGGGSGGAPGSQSVPMTDEAQQIAVQIQAIRDNLSITRNESNYLINQLKLSLPQELQNQLEMV
ncbi:Prion-like-(Q/N-rich) domain-bearing protein 8 [Caenorhabditis elegans]|uniref:Prion-like-(Q/N-rich) domain-bearing protein 8 n=1 Tax=Caenorhabditis elegans TaxID=6239 RepID=UPI00077FE55B|nr:Prion-like-(Q/N-rich) domain-bearing protein 8 [Caenorhabditis elegans]CAA83596.2 Prion-like-(Q/N-rich) domain-bearing protein 8 [Caenorhabditis elegans]|eukprot:NP_001309437.1 Prion-like-(Q/N-rich) domain-bearing protein 8 [Caenorhabditis elegans]